MPKSRSADDANKSILVVHKWSMATKKLQTTPYHDISSILELGKSDVHIQLQKPVFGKESLNPHRGSYFCVLMLTEGSVNHMANLQHFQAQKNMIIFSSPGIIKCWDQPSPDLDGYSLLFTADFFHINSHQPSYFNQLPFFQWDAQHFVQISNAARKILEPLFKKIQKELHDQQPKHNLAIQSYLNILLIELEMLYVKSTSRVSQSLPKSVMLANEFKCLVSHHFYQKLSVKQYADMLNVTPNHLNDTVKSVSGKTAGSLIQEMTLLEAKVLLHQTQITIAEIAFHLNFQEPSYFGRFFKKQTGMTPFQYRQSYPTNPWKVPDLRTIVSLISPKETVPLTYQK